MRLFATSDLHLDQQDNFLAFQASLNSPITTHNDCLVLAGDICESESQLENILRSLRPRFREIIWTAGNHELWIRPSQLNNYSGSEDKYQRMVEICQSMSVRTPEDDFLIFENEGMHYVIAPLFLLYDYSFRPANVPREKALEWAMESNLLCSDEVLINSRPYEDVAHWCSERVAMSEQKLAVVIEENPHVQLVLINHFPLCEQSFHLERTPRFSIWCGTQMTERWHLEYPVKAVISGHLHLPSYQLIDGVDFHEVSLGYPGQWDSAKNMLESFVPIQL